MTRSHAKRVKEAMGLLAQATMDEASIVTNKETSLMLGLEKKYEVEQFDSSNQHIEKLGKITIRPHSYKSYVIALFHVETPAKDYGSSMQPHSSVLCGCIVQKLLREIPNLA